MKLNIMTKVQMHLTAAREAAQMAREGLEQVASNRGTNPDTGLSRWRDLARAERARLREKMAAYESLLREAEREEQRALARLRRISRALLLRARTKLMQTRAQVVGDVESLRKTQKGLQGILWRDQIMLRMATDKELLHQHSGAKYAKEQIDAELSVAEANLATVDKDIAKVDAALAKFDPPKVEVEVHHKKHHRHAELNPSTVEEVKAADKAYLECLEVADATMPVIRKELEFANEVRAKELKKIRNRVMEDLTRAKWALRSAIGRLPNKQDRWWWKQATGIFESKPKPKGEARSKQFGTPLAALLK